MAGNKQSTSTPKKIYRSRTDRIIFGVCGGLGEYFQIDATIFRILFLLLFFCGAAGLILYLLMAILIPKNSATGGFGGQDGSLSANLKNRVQELAAEIKSNKSLKLDRRTVFASLVIFLGVWLILQQIFPSYNHWLSWSVFWPLAIIFIGLAIIVRGKK